MTVLIEFGLRWLSSDWRVQASVVFVAHAMLRLFVALSSHSGQGEQPRHGDFEAQRHWMEVTMHVPLHDWYRGSTPGNELTHWGLDYPPLTAFVAFVHGHAIQLVANDSHAFDLVVSRGREDDVLKLGMRMSVLLSEILVYWPAVVWLVVCIRRATPSVPLWSSVALILLQPSLLLIDHAHFQYNTICLGLALLAVCCVLTDRPYWATVCFCAALNYKQMALYYAPAFFLQMLGDAARLGSWRRSLTRVVLLGAVAIATFAVIWLPWLWLAAVQGDWGALLHVVGRLFPWERGLYEDKVANFWCSISPLVKLNGRYQIALLRQLCLASTMVMILPASLSLLVVRTRSAAGRARLFLMGLFVVSLSFFLFSYQVHEKSLLLPLLPLALLAGDRIVDTHALVASLSLMGHFSMYPLAQKDHTQWAYVALAALFFTAQFGGSWPFRWLSIGSVSALGVSIIHMLIAFVAPPARLPDLFTLACTAFSFCHFAVAWLLFSIRMWRGVEDEDDLAANKVKQP